ncbi:Protocadherin Fat 4 [Schistosoma japonicum]|nr:Protocadherin Fat 4 [Schistosoma japonicum]
MFNQMILTIISLYIIFIIFVRGVPDAPLRVDIIEESPTGSIVPGVAEYLQQLISREQIKGLTQTTTTFQLMNDGIFSNLFNLDSNTGRLIISGRIDREVLCPPWDNTGGTRPISISGSISSNILTTQRNSNLINGNDFSNSSPNDCIQALNILIITRPNQQSQHLTPGTIDKHVDSSVKTIRILVHVVIHDINDNAPRWHDISILHVNFVETPSLPSNNGWNNVQTILRPINKNDAIRNAKSIDRAYDPDLGSNGSIVYRLIGPGSDYFRLGDNFNRNTNNDNIDAYHIQANSESLIHRKTDLTMDLYNTNINNNNNNNLNLITSTHETALQIWPILPLDRETKDFAGQGGIYNLTLLASDLGIPPKSTSIPLIITLIDVNDHIPQFHNPINQYEVNNHFNTNNNNNLESNYVVYRPLNGNLRETIPIGSFVLQLNASDQDDGLHSKLIYGFCPCDRNLAQNYFKVDSITGRITVSHSLDYDNGPRQFRFKVIAKDSAPEPYTLTGTAIVEIILSDENDETPQINVMLLQPNSVHDTIPLIQHSFLSNKMKPNPDGAKLLREFTTTINENPQPETVIAYVQVYDPDHHGQDHIHCRLGPTDNFTLQYDPSSSSSSASSLVSSSSTISNSLLYFTKHNPLYENSLQQRSLTNTIQNKQDYRLITGTRLTDLSSSYSRLDREITPTQTITLTCTDSVGNSAYVLINVHLSDLNDNSPEFVNNGHFVFQIPENQELPDNKPIWLGRTIAVDNDQGVNALITYRLENSDHILNEYGNTDSDTITHSVNNIIDMFELNPQTGDLYVKVVFDRETAPNDGMYRLKVLCVDNGEPSLTGTAQVEIFILDENDWPPQFTREVYTFSVPENIRIHEIVGEVEAIDRDADSKGKITYQLVSHSYQPVNELSDWMSLSSNQHNSRRLHLRTPDSEFNVNEKISSLEVENTELNNTFDSKSMKHKQSNKTSKQSFEMRNSNIQQEKVEKTTLSNSTNELSRNRMKSLKYINYSHSEKPPTLLNYFAVDRLTGKIRLIRALDRESVAFFTIEIVAVDSAPISPITSLRQINSMMSMSNINNVNVNLTSKNAYYTPVHKSLSSTATVVIAVTDINDNSPIFRRPNTSTAIQLSLHETLGRQLLTMEATDADEGENARITYQIKSEVPRPPGGSGTGHFAIDESSGMLFIARPLNNTTTHRFVVEACDGGAGSTKRCTLSPSIRINVYDGLHEPITNSNGELLVYQSGTGMNNDNYHQNHRQSDLSFDLDDLTVGSVMAAQNGRRNEIVVVCLVVIFSILLMATILLVICLIHRRGLSVRHWVVNRTENLSTDKQDCKKDLNIMNKAVNNRSNIDLWMENQVPDEQSELRTDMKLESKSPLQYGMTNMSIDGNIQAYPSQNELSSPTRVLSNNILLSYHQPTVISPILPDIQHQHHHSMLSQIDHTPMNNNTNTLSPSRLRLLSTTPMGISPCGVYNKRESSIPHVLSNSEVNHLLTQSSYRPPSPDYQSLDAIWCNQNKFPSSTMSAIHRVHNINNNSNNNNNSINSTNHHTQRLSKNHQKLLTTHYSLGNSDNSVKHQLNNTQQHMMMSNDLIDSSLINSSQVTSENAFLPHAYYEIATPSETWHTRCLPIFIPNSEQHRILNDHHNNETHINLHAHHSNNNNNHHQLNQQKLTEFNSRSYNHIATLGRPSTGKGRRHLPTSTINHINDDSMYNLQAGELAIHSVKRSLQHEQCRMRSNDKLLMKSQNLMNLDKINCDNINKVVDSNTYHDGDNIDVTSTTNTTTTTTKNDNKSSTNEHDVEKLQNDQLLEQKTTVQHYTYQAFREGTFV